MTLATGCSRGVTACQSVLARPEGAAVTMSTRPSRTVPEKYVAPGGERRAHGRARRHPAADASSRGGP